MTRIAVCGAAGRMGKSILETCNETDGVTVTAAIEHSSSSMLGLDAFELAGLGRQGINIVDSI